MDAPVQWLLVSEPPLKRDVSLLAGGRSAEELGVQNF
jgi:hypothetical protein